MTQSHMETAPPAQPTERRSLLCGHPPLDFGFLRRMQLDAEVQRSAELDVLTEWTLPIAQMQGWGIAGFEIHFMLSEGIVATSRPLTEYSAAKGWALAMVCADEMAQRRKVDSESLALLCRLALRTGGDRPPPKPEDLGWWVDAANARIQDGLDAESAIASQAELCLALCAAWPGAWPAAHIASQIPRMAAGQAASMLPIDVYWEHQDALDACLRFADAWRRRNGVFHPASGAVQAYSGFLRDGQVSLEASVECWATLQEKRCADARKARASGLADAFLPMPAWPDGN